MFRRSRDSHSQERCSANAHLSSIRRNTEVQLEPQAVPTLTFPPFVGEPNKEIDEAWKDLTGGEHRVIAFGATAVDMSTKL